MRMTHEILQFADRCEGHKSKFSPYIAGDFAQFKILLIFEKLSSVARSMLAITRIRPRRLCAPPARRKQRKRGAEKAGLIVSPFLLLNASAPCYVRLEESLGRISSRPCGFAVDRPQAKRNRTHRTFRFLWPKNSIARSRSASRNLLFCEPLTFESQGFAFPDYA